MSKENYNKPMIEKKWSPYHRGLMCPACKKKAEGNDDYKECIHCGQRFIIPIRWD